jgi:hypothetical protein
LKRYTEDIFVFKKRKIEEQVRVLRKEEFCDICGTLVTEVNLDVFDLWNALARGGECIELYYSCAETSWNAITYRNGKEKWCPLS